jgi:hypothetical protein
MAKHHFIPQFILKNFQTKEGIWSCKQGGTWRKHQGVKSIAFEDDLYDDDTEREFGLRYENIIGRDMHFIREGIERKIKVPLWREFIWAMALRDPGVVNQVREKVCTVEGHKRSMFETMFSMAHELSQSEKHTLVIVKPRTPGHSQFIITAPAVSVIPLSGESKVTDDLVDSSIIMPVHPYAVIMLRHDNQEGFFPGVSNVNNKLVTEDIIEVLCENDFVCDINRRLQSKARVTFSTRNQISLPSMLHDSFWLR